MLPSLLPNFGPTGWSPPPSPLSARSTPFSISTETFSGSFHNSTVYSMSNSMIKNSERSTYLQQYTDQNRNALGQYDQHPNTYMTRSNQFEQQRSVSAVGRPLHQVFQLYLLL